MTDHAVNEWTRDDLPEVPALRQADDERGTGNRSTAFDIALDVVVDHLNANGGVPASREDAALADRLERQAATIGELQGSFLRVERDAARWRRAHEIVEQERDQAREQWKKWKQEHDLLVVHGSVRGDTYAAMVRDRDDWRDKAYSDSEGMRKAVSRAEAAEARTAPAVTKAEVGKVVREALVLHGVAPERVTDAAWSLLSGSDPAVHVVRESELPEVENKGDGGWDSGGQWYPSYATTEIIRENIARSARNLVNDLAVARAIEAGQAVDPLLDKAQEFAALADWELTDREAGLLHTVARHVLGQEASDGR